MVSGQILEARNLETKTSFFLPILNQSRHDCWNKLRCSYSGGVTVARK